MVFWPRPYFYPEGHHGHKGRNHYFPNSTHIVCWVKMILLSFKQPVCWLFIGIFIFFCGTKIGFMTFKFLMLLWMKNEIFSKNSAKLEKFCRDFMNKILLPRNEFFCKNHHHNRLSIANCYNFCTNFLVNLRYTGVQIQSQFLASILTNRRRWVKIMYLGSKTTKFLSLWTQSTWFL